MVEQLDKFIVTEAGLNFYSYAKSLKLELRCKRTDLILFQARGRSQQNNLIVHWNAKFHLSRSSCHSVSWKQSSSSTSMLSGCNGYHRSLPCLFLGQWFSNPGLNKHTQLAQ